MKISSDERQTIGANIRRLREDAGVSLTALARDVEIERTYFHDIERGTANATFEKYERIASALGVTVRDLLEPPPKGGKRRGELSGVKR